MGSLLSYHRFVFYLLAIYALFILCLGIPYIQRGAIYLHWARLPINADFNSPELYGIAPGQVRNFQLTTPDGAKIGVWHALPEAVYMLSGPIRQFFIPMEMLLPELRVIGPLNYVL